MTSAINDDRNPRKKSKRRKEKEEIVEKKSKKHKDKEEGDGSVTEPGMEARKKEKKKKKQKNDTPEDDVILDEEDTATSKREKKKRKRDIEINDDGVDAVVLPKKKRKKTHKSDSHEPIDSIEMKSISAEGDSEEATGTRRKKSKKNRKNKTGFFDPEQDEETDLPEQARKALSYAFRRFRDPDGWKFNKAKQNWLVRNLWNFQSLPVKYEDLVVKYLSAVQGNTRQSILETCKKTLDQNNTSEVSDKPVSAGGPIIDTPHDDDQKKARAQALLKAFAPESAS